VHRGVQNEKMLRQYRDTENVTAELHTFALGTLYVRFHSLSESHTFTKINNVTLIM